MVLYAHECMDYSRAMWPSGSPGGREKRHGGHGFRRASRTTHNPTYLQENQLRPSQDNAGTVSRNRTRQSCPPVIPPGNPQRQPVPSTDLNLRNRRVPLMYQRGDLLPTGMAALLTTRPPPEMCALSNSNTNNANKSLVPVFTSRDRPSKVRLTEFISAFHLHENTP